MLAICGAVSELLYTSGSAVSPSMSLSLKDITLSIFSAISVIVSFTATPRPAIAGTFSVPERIFFCWPPPYIIGLIRVPFFTYRKPEPLGP